MNLQLLWPLLITTLVAIVGWFIAHALSVSRDKANKRREQRIGYLIEAYRKLESSACRFDHTEMSLTESAIADIQLFGTASQAESAKRLAYDLAEHRTANMDELLADLRNDLRSELNLSPLEERPVHFRYNSGAPPANNSLQARRP